MIAITGGGTGGHLSVAKAIKDELVKLGIKPIFIGSKNGQDKFWFENDDGFSEKYFFNSVGVVNKELSGKFNSLKNILSYSLECKEIFKKHSIKVIFSVGGYSSAPASIASVIFLKKLYIHEQNAIFGTLNRVLKPFAKSVFSSYSTTSPLKNYPIRDIFFQSRRVREDVKKIIFLGGSQGARAINDFALSSALRLSKMGISIIHQAGAKDYQRVYEEYKKLGIKVELFEFSKKIDEKIKEADFAVSRAGASTLWELVASQIPTLFVPYPYAVKNHQYFNAKFLVDKGLAFLSKEDDLSEDLLIQCLGSDIEHISRDLIDIIEPNGAKEIAQYLLNSLNS